MTIESTTPNISADSESDLVFTGPDVTGRVDAWRLHERLAGVRCVAETVC